MDNAIQTSGAKSRNLVGILTGLLFGGLAGFVAMMLLAPRSGKETRGRIKDKGIQLQDRAGNTFDDLVALSRFDNRQFLAGTREEAASD